MRRSEERILTTHVGSLIRPPEIIDAMIARENGESIDSDAYEAALRDGVREVVNKQVEVGLDVVNDGEFGKIGWVPYVIERLTGLEAITEFPMPEGQSLEDFEPDRFAGFMQTYLQHETTLWLPETKRRADYKGGLGAVLVACKGPIEYKPEQLQRDIENLKAALTDTQVEEAFLPVAAPCSVELIPNQYYKSDEEYLYALADALSVEYKMIVDAGFILQVDDAILPMRYFTTFHGASDIEEYKRWARIRMEALNHALERIPEDRVRYHMCYGSQNVPHTTDPPLSEMIDLILMVNAQAYLIESGNPRHEHEWRVWEDVALPDGKILIPGVISHSTNVVEHPELVAMRIENHASLLGRENVMAGTDCGFSQFWNLVRVHPEVQWAKLEALVEGARIASARLWKTQPAPLS